jgi:hypothetical protein
MFRRFYLFCNHNVNIRYWNDNSSQTAVLSICLEAQCSKVLLVV